MGTRENFSPRCNEGTTIHSKFKRQIVGDDAVK
jgi:hypothetical protein